MTYYYRLSASNTASGNAAKGILALVKEEYFHPYIEKGIEGMLNKKANTGLTDEIAQTKKGLWVYPNPASNSVQVLFKVTQANAQNTITLTDVLGKTIETKTYNHLTGLVTFNTAAVVNGTYFINLVSNGKLMGTQKVIVQH